VAKDRITARELARATLIVRGLSDTDPRGVVWLADQWLAEGLISIHGLRLIAKAIDAMPAERRRMIGEKPKRARKA